MRGTASIGATTLRWVQPRRRKRAFELLDGDRRVGDLEWSGPFGRSAAGGFGGERWMFEPPRWLTSDVAVIQSRSGEPSGLLRWSWFRATLRGTPGGDATWNPGGLFRGLPRFLEEGGAPLVAFVVASRLFRLESRVQSAPSAAARPDYRLLIVLGWYLIVLERSTPSE